MNRKRLLLIALLVALALSFGYAYRTMPRQNRVETSRAEAHQQKPAPGAKDQPGEAKGQRLQFELLGEEPAPFPGAERDIFNFQEKKMVVAKPPKPAEQPEAAPPPPPPASRQIMQKELSEFRFLGFLEIADRQMVFLSSGDEIYVVRQGDRFGRDKEFEVKDISENILMVQRRGQMDMERISLIEKDSLDTSISAPARITPLPMPAMQETELPQGMPAPARRGTSIGPDQNGMLPEVMDKVDSNPFQGQEPSIGMENPEGEVNGTN